MTEKINVLCVPSDHYGCGKYRSLDPHVQLNNQCGDEFNVDINYTPNIEDLDYFKKYDILHFHKGIFPNMEAFWQLLDFCKENKIVTIIDVDDNWNLNPQHPLYAQNKASNNPMKTEKNLSMCDYVTTTTDIFANYIKRINKNVHVFPNAINTDEDQFKPIKNESKRIRFGFVMGSSHERDMELFRGVVNSLPQDIMDKIQIVLCGYDLRGTVTELNPDGSIRNQRPIQPHESVWYRYEQNVTDNYRIVGPAYHSFLEKFTPNLQWPNVENEAYRREWTMDLNNFGKHYRNVDVLIVPLDENDFNKMKSELKLIEAGFTNTAVIASNFGPYTIGTKNLFEYGGGINPEGNCILVDKRKVHKDWANAIKKLVKNPELIDMLKTNLHNSVKDKYDIRTVTEERAEWYKKIVAEKKNN